MGAISNTLCVFDGIHIFYLNAFDVTYLYVYLYIIAFCIWDENK